MSQKIKLVEEIIETIIRTVFHMFKKLEERLSMISRLMEDIKEIQIKFEPWKTRKKTEINNIPKEISKRLAIVEEKIKN